MGRLLTKLAQGEDGLREQMKKAKEGEIDGTERMHGKDTDNEVEKEE